MANPEVICTPGGSQASPAHPDDKVQLTPSSGMFPVQEGTVYLVADGAPSGRDTMDPWTWSPASIMATVPGIAPGAHPYRVEIIVGNQTFTGRIYVANTSGEENDPSGYPPAHRL